MQKIFFIVFIITIVIIIIPFISYFHILSNEDEIIRNCQFCNSKDNEKCMGKAFTLLLPELLIHKAESNGKELKFWVYDWMSRFGAETAAEAASALISYGVLNDVIYEKSYIDTFQQPVYMFDCGIAKSPEDIPGVIFAPECIGTDKYLINDQKSSTFVHNFGDKLKELGFEHKKIWLKMDIAGAEIEVLPDILKYSDNITGMNLALHIDNPQRIIRFIKIMKEVNKKFVLVGRHPLPESIVQDSIMYSKYYRGNVRDYTLELSYINKNLVSRHYISLVQDSQRLFKIGKNYKYAKNADEKIVPYNNISYVVTFTELFKEKICKLRENQF